MGWWSSMNEVGWGFVLYCWVCWSFSSGPLPNLRPTWDEHERSGCDGSWERGDRGWRPCGACFVLVFVFLSLLILPSFVLTEVRLEIFMLPRYLIRETLLLCSCCWCSSPGGRPSYMCFVFQVLTVWFNCAFVSWCSFLLASGVAGWIWKESLSKPDQASTQESILDLHIRGGYKEQNQIVFIPKSSKYKTSRLIVCVKQTTLTPLKRKTQIQSTHHVRRVCKSRCKWQSNLIKLLHVAWINPWRTKPCPSWRYIVIFKTIFCRP